MTEYLKEGRPKTKLKKLIEGLEKDSPSGSHCR